MFQAGVAWDEGLTAEVEVSMTELTKKVRDEEAKQARTTGLGVGDTVADQARWLALGLRIQEAR